MLSIQIKLVVTKSILRTTLKYNLRVPNVSCVSVVKYLSINNKLRTN